MKRCHTVREEIQDAAIVCKHCGRDLVSTASAQKVGIVRPKKTGRGCSNTVLGVGLLIAVLIGFTFMFNESSPTLATLLPVHREAVEKALAARALTAPAELSLSSVGFVAAGCVLTNACVRQLKKSRCGRSANSACSPSARPCCRSASRTTASTSTGCRRARAW